MGDDVNMGDRTLAVWIGDGYLHYATYNLNFPPNPNLWNNIPYNEKNLERWFWIYYGYSSAK